MKASLFCLLMLFATITAPLESKQLQPIQEQVSVTLVCELSPSESSIDSDGNGTYLNFSSFSYRLKEQKNSSLTRSNAALCKQNIKVIRAPPHQA